MQVNMCVAICVYVSMLTPCPSAKLTGRWIKVKLRPRDALCTLHRNSHNPLFFLLVQSSSPSYEPPPHFHHSPLFILPCPRHGPWGNSLQDLFSLSSGVLTPHTHTHMHNQDCQEASHTSAHSCLRSRTCNRQKQGNKTPKEPTFLDFFFFSPPSHSHIPPALPLCLFFSLSPKRQSWMWKAVSATQSHKRPARTQRRPGHLQPRLTDPLASFARASPPVATVAAALETAVAAEVVWVTLASLAAALREQAKAPCSSAPDRLVLSSRASWGHGSSRALTATSSTECPSRYVR